MDNYREHPQIANDEEIIELRGTHYHLDDNYDSLGIYILAGPGAFSLEKTVVDDSLRAELIKKREELEKKRLEEQSEPK